MFLALRAVSQAGVLLLRKELEEVSHRAQELVSAVRKDAEVAIQEVRDEIGHVSWIRRECLWPAGLGPST